jgi:hypothetical protein
MGLRQMLPRQTNRMETGLEEALPFAVAILTWRGTVKMVVKERVRVNVVESIRVNPKGAG